MPKTKKGFLIDDSFEGAYPLPTEAPSLDEFHMGPGDHPSGSPQSVHAGDDEGKNLDTKQIKNLYDWIVAKAKNKEEAGFSYQPFTHDLNPPTGFMSSEYEDRGKPIPMADFKRSDLYKYAVENAEYFKDSKLYMGGWVSDDVMYLDISQRFETREAGLESAIKHHQLGIFDLSTKTTIYTSTKFDPNHPNYDEAIADLFKKGGEYPGP